jgi:hypothetical protein
MGLLEPIAGTSLYPELASLANQLSGNAMAAHIAHLNALGKLELARAALMERQVNAVHDSRVHVAKNRAGRIPGKVFLAEMTEDAIAEDEFVKQCTQAEESQEQTAAKIEGDAELAANIARNKLAAKIFFAYFFSRPEIDLSHPLGGIKIGDALVNRTFELPTTPAFNLAHIVRDDIVALRAWRETGGLKIDQALADKGRPLPVPNRRRKFTMDDLVSCLKKMGKKNPTLQEIVDAMHTFSNGKINVSKGAVSLMMSRAFTTLQEINPYAL